MSIPQYRRYLLIRYQIADYFSYSLYGCLASDVFYFCGAFRRGALGATFWPVGPTIRFLAWASCIGQSSAKSWAMYFSWCSHQNKLTCVRFGFILVDFSVRSHSGNVRLAWISHPLFSQRGGLLQSWTNIIFWSNEYGEFTVEVALFPVCLTIYSVSNTFLEFSGKSGSRSFFGHKSTMTLPIKSQLYSVSLTDVMVKPSNLILEFAVFFTKKCRFSNNLWIVYACSV